MSYLNDDGLLYLWQRLKVLFAGKVDKVDGKQLSTNDYTTAEMTKLKGIAEGANKTTVENVLTSNSTGNALAAAQGKVLDEKITELQNSLGGLGYGDMLKSVYDTNDNGIVDNAEKLGGNAPSYYAKAADLSSKLDTTGAADNVTVNFSAAASRANIVGGEKLSVSLGKIAKYFTDLKAVAFSGSYNDLTNKPTITNDLSDELKANYDAAYTHSQTAHAPANAQANIIEGVKVNGSAVTLVGKVANITVPTTVASLSDAGNYALKSDLANVYKYAGSVATITALPASAVAGTVYNVESDGMNYAWNGTEWDNLGAIFEIEAISNSEIDNILAN